MSQKRPLDGAANPSVDMYIGAVTADPVGSFDGSIAEIVVISESPSDETRQILEGYLAWKWGLQDDLPDGHPYEIGLQDIHCVQRLHASVGCTQTVRHDLRGCSRMTIPRDPIWDLLGFMGITTTHLRVSDPPHCVGQDQHSYTPCSSDLEMNVRAIFARQQ